MRYFYKVKGLDSDHLNGRIICANSHYANHPNLEGPLPENRVTFDETTQAWRFAE